ncbi:hypothetical protein DIPPA_33492 [Diplonema papillatum]|nr:hypothetical protein DIPPA_01233 [Diplonema papillatum]KAJ9457025.1 hypothetical protein DIPPA_33492 [Diplonema papillatum]
MPPKAQARNGDELLEREKRMEELERSLKEREDKLREAEERLKEQQQQRGRPLEDPDEPRAKRSRPAPQQELRPEALLPMLDVDRAGAIFDAFEDEYPGFWQKMDADALQELALAGDEREALELLDRHVPPVGNSMVLDEDEEDDFKMLEATFWKDAPIGVGGFALLEGTVSRLYRFRSNRELQERRDDVTTKVREHLRMRGPMATPMWLLKLTRLFNEYEQLQAVYDTRNPAAGVEMRGIQEASRLPRHVAEARRRLKAAIRQRGSDRSTSAKGPSAICHNFRNGRCMRERCRFRHVAAPQRVSVPPSGKRNAPPKNE